MVADIGRLLGLLAAFGLVCSCSGSSTTTKGNNATVCERDTRRCVDDKVMLCNALGSAETVEVTCESGRCRTQGDDAYCTIVVGNAGSAGSGGSGGSTGSSTGSAGTANECTANQPVCDGRFATKCKADGSGPQPDGVDCAASSQTCIRGRCRDTECVGGTKSCKDGDVYVCAADGSGLSLSVDCREKETCDESSGFCVTRVCEPDKSVCEGSRVVTCNALGTARLPASTDCAAQGLVCLDGSCVKKTCAASTTFCQGNDLYQCDPVGATSTLSKTCPLGREHCEVTPAGLYAFCVSNVCTAGQKLCAGDKIKICNADGSLPADGTACASNEYCEDATCKPRGCDEIGSLFCKGDDMYSCQHEGAQLYTECEPNQVCHAILTSLEQAPIGDATGAVFCAPPICPPGTSSCALNKIGPCAADGKSLSSVTTDCAASGTICTTSGTCAASTVDTLGKNEVVQTISELMFVGNAFEVRSARKLTELQMWLVLAAARDVRWMIYEQVGNQFVLRAEKTTSVSNSAGFVSSGALSYQLQAGKRYVVGTQVSGESIGIYEASPFETHVSFGTLLGSVAAYDSFDGFAVSGSFWPNSVSGMKMTTESP